MAQPGLGSRSLDELFCARPLVWLFFVATLLVLPVTVITTGGVDLSQVRGWQQIPWDILCVACPLGLLFIFAGMWIYWVKVDRSKRARKRLWFVVLLVGAWYGSCLYYYFAYLPQVRRKWKAGG